MTARRTPSAWWLLAAPAACVGILGLSEPVLFVWLLVGLIIGWALVASFMWALWRERAIAAESELMYATRPVEVVGSKGTRLRIVPTQTPLSGRISDLLPVADGFFPVHDRIEDDELTALIRATEDR